MATQVSEVPGMIEDALREVSRIKSVVADAVEEGVRSAMNAIEQGRQAADDAVGQARQSVTQKPFQSMGIVFAAGILTGSLLTWMLSHRE